MHVYIYLAKLLLTLPPFVKINCFLNYLSYNITRMQLKKKYFRLSANILNAKINCNGNLIGCCR